MGHGSDQARDLTQAFFTRLLENEFLRKARPERGRFRSYVLASVRHFLSNQHEHRRALKRGGGSVVVSLELEDGERRYQLEPADGLTPERIYERRWAQSVFDNAMRRVASQHTSAGRESLFLRLRPLLTDDSTRPSSELAAELGMSEGALRVAVHRLRRQFAATLRSTIAETVERPEDVDDEMRYLLKIVSR
jgi:RNA polymerase sigma-70 factor (ECF subfamily)